MLIKHPLYLGRQTFRINRAVPKRDNTGKPMWALRPGWWKTVYCERSGDPCYDHGFRVRLEFAGSRDEIALNRERYKLIRDKSGKTFTETWQDNQLAVTFEFPAGQRCFGHSVPVQRDPVFANLNRRDGTKIMYYDQFFDTFNEVITRQKQHRRQF